MNRLHLPKNAEKTTAKKKSLKITVQSIQLYCQKKLKTNNS